MVRLFALITLFISLNVNAQNVNLDFTSVSVNELCQLVLKGILKRDFVISPEVLADDRKLSMNLKNMDEKNVLTFFTGFLKEYQIDLQDDKTVIYLRKKLTQPVPELPQTVKAENQPGEGAQSNIVTSALPIRLYTPKNRSVLELLPLFKALMLNPTYSETSETIIYFADDEAYERVQLALKTLDSSKAQILVSAHLYEFNKSKSSASAFNVAINLLNNKLKLNLNAAAKTHTLSAVFGDIQAVLSALDTDSRFTVVSNPTLRLTDGKLSKFSVGSETPVLDSVTSNASGQLIQSVNYRPSGVIFEVKPRIYADAIQLDLMQQVSNFVTTTSGVNNSPTLIKRELKTSLDVKDGEIVFMGGLADKKDSSDNSGLAWLPSLFQTKSKENSQSDIFLVLQVQRL